jgi:hypothetical protein
LLDLGASVVAQAWTPYDVSAWNASPTEADAVFDELKELGPVKQIPADFAQPESPAAVMDAAKAAFGHVDILIVRMTCRCTASVSAYASAPNSCKSCVDPSTSVKRKVTVPVGSSRCTRHDHEPRRIFRQPVPSRDRTQPRGFWFVTAEINRRVSS